MTSELRAYPEYKDSGLPWLGKVPTRWLTTPLRRVCHIQTGVTLGKKYDGLSLEERPYLRVANVQNGYLNLKHVKRIAVPQDEAVACELLPGDVVVTEGGDIDKLGRGAVWQGQIPGCIHQNHIFAIRPQRQRLNPHFLALMMESPYGRTYFETTAKKTTNLASTNRTTLGQFPVVLPPPEEQAAIADYLDANAALVRKYIRNRRRLIEVLSEQKQAIINQAVTRGLDPTVPLKPSGTDWLEDVPEHWDVKPLKRWVSINERVLPETTDPDYAFDYLDIGCVGTGILISKPSRIRFGDAPSRARRILRRGDTIISTVRTYLRAVYFVGEEVNDLIASTGFAVLTPGPGVVPEFLGITLQSDPFINRVTANSVGIAYPAIAETRLGTFHLALPPTVEEQASIVAEVRRQTEALTRGIERAQREIDLIREYRTRLIADVVTGKLDVRHLVPPRGGLEADELAGIDADEGFDDEPAEDEAADLIEETADADD